MSAFRLQAIGCFRPIANIDASEGTALAALMSATFLSLIEAVQQGSMTVGDFTSSVEREWNFGDERATLSETHKSAVQHLFDVVVYYSPFPDERARFPIYSDEQDVLLAAQVCRRALERDVR